ncbi:NlpC/P60 family protein [Maribacter chungangensis]|uniref:NlpC/P60 family protein n=1 Tax=Maribacter chungangensis TaxID=1069117 RepID=A0ABW3B958_9FLAO
MHIRFGYIVLVLMIFVGCKTETPTENAAQHYIDELQKEVAPDKRVAVFKIEAQLNAEGYILKGETDKPNALQRLRDSLVANNISFTDSVTLLPTAELGDTTRAIINISVANLRSNPKHSAELATQATLGTPVKVLKKEGDWYYIQTPDNYLAWVDDGGITLFTEQTIQNWESADKVIYTKTYGHAYKGPDRKEIVSDLVAGNVLEVLKYADKFYIVRFPDGRQAYVFREASETYKDWLAKLNNTPEALVQTSKRFMGVPYLWGGTSTKGMDCSGFTKTIYFLNGMIIPRDASQQVHTGKPIDDTGNFDVLEPGDLLFFGTEATDETKEKVVHVGMWIGNNEFIHASDMVRVSSVDKEADNYDAYNVNRYLRTKRILREEDMDLIDLRKVALFK